MPQCGSELESGMVRFVAELNLCVASDERSLCLSPLSIIHFDLMAISRKGKRQGKSSLCFVRRFVTTYEMTDYS